VRHRLYMPNVKPVRDSKRSPKEKGIEVPGHRDALVPRSSRTSIHDGYRMGIASKVG